MSLVDYECSDSDEEKEEEVQGVERGEEKDEVDSNGVAVVAPLPQPQPQPKPQPQPQPQNKGQSLSGEDAASNKKRKLKSDNGVVSFAIPALKQLKTLQKEKKEDEDEDSDEDAGIKALRSNNKNSSLNSLLPPPKNAAKNTTTKRSAIDILADKLGSNDPNKFNRIKVAVNKPRDEDEGFSATTAATSSYNDKAEGDSGVYYQQQQYNQAYAQPRGINIEETPEFLPKHMRDTFTENSHVIEVNQSDLTKDPERALSSVARTFVPTIQKFDYQTGSVQKNKGQLTYLIQHAADNELMLAEKRAAAARAQQQTRSRYGW